MIINPLNVVSIYKCSISNRNTSHWSRNRIKRTQKLLLDSIFHYNELEVTEEIYLDYQEPYKHNSEIIQNDEVWSEDNLNSHPPC